MRQQAKKWNVLTVAVLLALGSAALSQVARAEGEYAGDSYITVDNENHKISLTVNGAIKENDTGLVTGGTVYNALYSSKLALGNKASATGMASTAIGNNVTAGNVSATAIGHMSKASNSNSTAVGAQSGASGSSASAFGYLNNASGSDSTAVGSQNSASNMRASALGAQNTANGVFATAVGYNNKVQKVTYDANMDETVTAVYGGSAIGVNNKSTETYGTAIGVQNTASGSISAAIGAANTTGGERASAVGVLNNAYGTRSGAFGYQNTIGAASDDGNGNTVFDAEKGQYTYVLGANNTVTANNAIVIGSQVSKVADNSVVIGAGSTSEEENTVSVGAAATTTVVDNEIVEVAEVTRRIVHLAAGVADTDGVNVSQIKTEAGTYIQASVKDGEDGKPVLNENGTVGKNLAALDMAIGAVDADYTFIKQSIDPDDATKNVSVAQNLIFLDQGVTQLVSYDKNTKVLSIGGGNDIAADATVSVGGRKITNVAAGEADTDAVNKAQLDQAMQGMGGTVQESIDRLDEDIHKVGAGAAALAALRPETFNPLDKWSFAVGYGHYKNANAGALGAFFKPNADTTVSIGSTIGNGNPMVNAGISFKLGQRGAGAGLTRGDAAVSQELASLRAENAAQQKEISSLRADNERMQKQIEMILLQMKMSNGVTKTVK